MPVLTEEQKKEKRAYAKAYRDAGRVRPLTDKQKEVVLMQQRKRREQRRVLKEPKPPKVTKAVKVKKPPKPKKEAKIKLPSLNRDLSKLKAVHIPEKRMTVYVDHSRNEQEVRIKYLKL